jgi:hypothetical protein
MTPTPTTTPVATNTPTATPAGTATFVPVADAFVDSANPNTNYGKATNLRVDGSPVVNSYLRFNVQGVTGTITKVTLKVYANSSQSRGYDVHGVADTTWAESSLTYNNAPTMGAVAGSSGAVSANTWTSVDVTALVTGNGLVSLGLTTASTTNLSLGSREAGANAPQLVVQTS